MRGSASWMVTPMRALADHCAEFDPRRIPHGFSLCVARAL
jgi:hypothetical protein